MDHSKTDEHLYAVMGPMIPGGSWQMAYWQICTTRDEALQRHLVDHPDVPVIEIVECM